MANTANYNWVKPTVGGDSGTWGSELNTDLDSIDTDLKAVSDVADAALPLAGGTMTGEISIDVASYRTVTMSGQSGAVTIDLSQGVGFILTFSGTPTFTFSNTPVVRAFTTFWMKMTNAGSVIPAWPASVHWTNGTTPTWSNSGVDIVEFVSFNSGGVWHGRALVTGATS